MGKSENFVLRLIPATPQEVLRDKLADLNLQIRVGFIIGIVTVFLCGVDMIMNYDSSSKTANFGVDVYNTAYAQEHSDDDGYVTVDDQLSVKLEVRCAGEGDWQPRATIAGWRETVEVRILAKVVLSTEDEPYSHPINLGSSNGLTEMERCEDAIISKTQESEGVVFVQEIIFRGQVTTKGWWNGYNTESISYYSDNCAERLVSVYVMPDFGYISKLNIFILLMAPAAIFCFAISAVIRRRKVLRKLRSLG